MQRNFRVRRVFLFVAMVLGVAATSKATVITLTGGDSTDGWVVPTTPFLFAYDLADTSHTIQGVPFLTWGTGATAPANGAGIPVTSNLTSVSFYTAPSYSSPTANDTAMAAMISTIFYNNSSAGVGPLTFTMTGLSANTPYVLDAFTYADGASTRNNETFKVNGATVDVISGTMEPATPPYISYLIANTVMSDGSGQIVFAVSSPNGGTPILSGLAVFATPEPSSFVLIGLGAALLLWKGRRRG